MLLSPQICFPTGGETARQRIRKATDMTDFEQIKQRLRQFSAVRDWDQFHSPKNLAMALIVEAAELVEHFQWLSEEQSTDLPADKLMFGSGYSPKERTPSTKTTTRPATS